MLTEAVRLMGVISGDQPLSSANMSSQTTPASAMRDPRTPPPAMSRPATPRPAPAPQPARETSRLRLTPLPSEVRAAETRPAQPPQRQTPLGQKTQGTRANESNGWSWRDLLNGMDNNGNPTRDPLEIPLDSTARPAQAPVDADFNDDLDDVMVGEVSAMGVDAASLLSRTRIDEMIGSIMAENNEGARNLVRRIAPAAVRRLNRRLMADPVLRQHASEFVNAYDQQVNIALMSKDASRGLQEVLSNDKGRAYLLIDAAIADLI
jgi:hypothetical protein